MEPITTQEERNLIYQDILLGIPKSKIAEKFNRSVATVQRIAKNPEIGRGRGAKRTAEFNDNYFEKIDTDEKAYWLGFLFADGCIHKASKFEHYIVKLSLDEIDEDHLKKFAKAIEFNFELGSLLKSKDTRTNGTMVTLRLTSKKMFEDLQNLGCVERKSNILETPKINKKFYRPFIRGFYDGDGGCVLNLKRNNFSASASFVSTFEIATFIKDLIFKKTNIYVGVCKFKHSKAAYRIGIGGLRNTFKFLNWLYEDFGSVKMDRKFIKAKEIMELFILRGNLTIKDSVLRNPNVRTSEILKIIKRFLGVEKLNVLLERSYKGPRKSAAIYEFMKSLVGSGNKTLDKKFQ